MTEDKFEAKLKKRIASEYESVNALRAFKYCLREYRAFKSEKPQPTEDEFDIAIETEQNKVINPGMLDMAVSDNDNYKLGFIHGLQKSKYVYRSLAPKPTAPASLVERLTEWKRLARTNRNHDDREKRFWESVNNQVSEILSSYTPVPDNAALVAELRVLNGENYCGDDMRLALTEILARHEKQGK